MRANTNPLHKLKLEKARLHRLIAGLAIFILLLAGLSLYKADKLRADVLHREQRILEINQKLEDTQQDKNATKEQLEKIKQQNETLEDEKKQLQKDLEAKRAGAAVYASSPNYAGGAGGVWAALRACECGGDYGCNTGNGFYGAYQFVPSTWWSVGGTGMPHEASPAEQDKRAKLLQARDGWGPWPACARKLGLL